MDPVDMTQERKLHPLLPALACLAVLALAFAAAPDALAQFGLGEAAAPSGLKNPGVPTLIGRIIKAALGFVGTLFLILMVYAGFLWMTARGDSKKVDQAKQLIAGAIIGVVIIAGSYAMTDFVIKSITGQATAGSETAPTGGTKQKGEACTGGQECQDPMICIDNKCT